MIHTAQFAQLRDLIRHHFGIRLDDREKLVRGRLRGLAREGGFDDVGAYLRDRLQAPDRESLSELADRLTTNHTHFDREREHYDFLDEVVLPERVAARSRAAVRDLRVWCAACSTGQEAYSLGIVLMEHLGLEYGRWHAGVLATDISSRALGVAEAGIYQDREISALRARWRADWFTEAPDGRWSVVEKLRREVLFRRFNLMGARYPFKRPFDVVFCRNVMIYFDSETRLRVASSIGAVAAPGAWLFIGLSETLPRSSGLPWRFVRPGVYRRV